MVCPPWWRAPELFIEDTAEKATVAHNGLISCSLDELVAEKESLNIYSDGVGINGQVGAAAWCPQLDTYEGASVGPLNCFTVYFGELYRVRLALEIAMRDRSQRTIRIFVDNQAAIRAVNALAGPSGQYVLRDIVTILDNYLPGRKVKLHWIPAHTGIPGNEKVDDLAKRATGWVPAGEQALPDFPCGGPQTSIGGVLIMDTWTGSAIRQRCDAATKRKWAAQWDQSKVSRKMHKIHPIPHKSTANAYRELDRKHSSLLAQARTGKATLAVHQYRKGNRESPSCFECQVPETLEHVIQNCPNHDSIRQKNPSWSGQRGIGH